MAKQIKKHGKIVLILGLTMVLLLIYLVIPRTQAAAISNREIKLSDSQTSASARYDFEGDHAATNVKCLEIAFCTTASGACTQPTGFTATTSSQGASSTWNGWPHASWTASTSLATRIRFTYATGTTGGSDYSFTATGVTNPSSAGTNYARVTTYSDATCSTSVDTGVVAFAVVSGVTVSATVPETLTFTIAGVTNSNCDTDFGVLAGPDSATTTVTYGSLSAVDTFHHACQDITVSTNANSGYSVTGQEQTNLRDTTLSVNIDDSTGDSGSMTESTTSTWATASGNAGFGYSCSDQSGSDCSLTATSLYRQFACIGADANCDPGSGSETAQTVLSNAGAVSGSQGRIEYKLTVGGTQQAGSYSNTIVYICTPTY